MAVTTSSTRSSAMYMLLVSAVMLRSGRVYAASMAQTQDCDEEQLNKAKLRFKVISQVIRYCRGKLRVKLNKGSNQREAGQKKLQLLIVRQSPGFTSLLFLWGGGLISSTFNFNIFITAVLYYQMQLVIGIDV